MKPVNKNVADDYSRESVSGVDAVFKRMLKTVGDYGEGYAQAFDVSENTIKTWRRRGAVSLRYLEGFARTYNVSLDHLLYGNEQATEPPPITLSADERVLLDGYRALDPATRKRLLAFVLGGEPPSAKRTKKQVFNQEVSGQVAMGKIINKGSGEK